jgi:hypothetical protein
MATQQAKAYWVLRFEVSQSIVTVCREYPGVDSRRYHTFCVAVGLEWGPLSPCGDI